MKWIKRAAALAAVTAIAGCSDKPQTAEDSAIAARKSVDSAVQASKVSIVPEGETAAPSNPRAPSPADRPAGEWEVTPQGIGGFRAGMSVDELRVVGAKSLDIPEKIDECAYIRPKNGPKGVALMIEKGKLARVDVTEGSVATAQGAKIGDSEDEIKSLYPGQVTVKPHKYTSGHYLVVTPPSDANARIVFETDGKKVLKYRSGHEPAVEYVEGCG
jgi:hypothetical protein